jgi:hypothetical protein
MRRSSKPHLIKGSQPKFERTEERICLVIRRSRATFFSHCVSGRNSNTQRRSFELESSIWWWICVTDWHHVMVWKLHMKLKNSHETSKHSHDSHCLHTAQESPANVIAIRSPDTDVFVLLYKSWNPVCRLTLALRTRDDWPTLIRWSMRLEKISALHYQLSMLTMAVTQQARLIGRE